MANTATKPKRTLAEIRKIRSEAGRKGGFAKRNGGRGKSLATLEKEVIRTSLEQRFMRVIPQLATAQISIATGQQFLFKIEKKKITGPKGGVSYVNEKPVLVTSQYEIESYLEELAENNGDISDDQDPAATYYYLTTKEPNNEALKDIQNRVFGKPKETLDVKSHHTFSLIDLHGARGMIDGNKDVTVLPAPVAELDAPTA